MPSSIDQTNESHANPNASPQRHVPPISSENDGAPVLGSNRRIAVQSANTPPSPSRLFMKNNAGDDYLNSQYSSIRSMYLRPLKPFLIFHLDFYVPIKESLFTIYLISHTYDNIKFSTILSGAK